MTLRRGLGLRTRRKEQYIVNDVPGSQGDGGEILVLRRRLKALEEEVKFYKDFADKSVEGVYRTTPDGRYVYANQALARIYGYDSPEDLIQNVTAAQLYFDPAERQEQRRLLDTFGEVHGFEARRVRKDGSVIWAAASIRAVKDNGVLQCFEGNVVDVTHRRQLQEQLETATREAEEARAQAAKANQAKSEFLSRMSHELRTPLNAILGFAQLLELDNLTPEQREGVDHILRGGRHLLQLINEVLDIARIESGRTVLSPEPVLVSEIVAESMDMARPIAAERKIRLVAEGSDAGLYVLADFNRLKQVLLNLLSNGIKYNRAGGEVSVTWSKSGSNIRIAVKDTGPGIRPDKMQRLFQPFDRLDAEQTGVEGTGLGLALSKSLVEAMKGSITVDSQAGLGSTFAIRLPVAEGPVQPEAAESQGPSELFKPAGQRTIVYAEDNLSNLRLMERVLARYKNVRLVPAMQGRIALDLVRTNQPDLILLDLNLPDISGEVLLQQIKDDPATDRIPVIIVSAEASPRHIQRLVDAGAHAYITKPIHVADLLTLLQQFLEGRREDIP